MQQRSRKGRSRNKIPSRSAFDQHFPIVAQFILIADPRRQCAVQDTETECNTSFVQRWLLSQFVSIFKDLFVKLSTAKRDIKIRGCCHKWKPHIFIHYYQMKMRSSIWSFCWTLPTGVIVFRPYLQYRYDPIKAIDIQYLWLPYFSGSLRERVPYIRC